MSEERRLVTVFFADVVGSTSLGENLDPEDVRGLLSHFFSLASEVVASHEGTLEKFIGDAVFAVFGMPQAHGDDAQRALSAGLELRDRVQADEVLREQLPIRLGVNTGEVVASADRSRGDFLVVGDAVNVAARLQQAAEAWEILCSERTARAAGDAFVFGEQVDLSLRGKSASTPARMLIGRSENRPKRRTPLVGREADLAQLDLVARRAFEERRPYMVSVTALPGVGKSRLVQEFVDRLPRKWVAARVLTAQCLPYGQSLTFWPLRGLLLDLLDLPEDSAGDEIQGALTGWLQLSGEEGTSSIAEVIAATIGIGQREIEDRATLQAAWRSLIEIASRRQALVVVVEDLHWASDSLLDLVEHLLQPRGELPLMMIALARPELLDRRRLWGGGRRNYVSLALEPLSEDDVGELVGHLLERSDPGIAQIVVERAEGNPFFVGEIVRAVLERAALGGEAIPPELPDTVQATVLARLDLLEPVARRFLQVGSVFGRSFRLDGVGAVEPELAPQVLELADGLIDRDLLDPPHRDVFVFRHILLREVAYGALPRAERARLHRRAAGWLAEQAGGREAEMAELVALHYREAAMIGRATSQVEGEVEEAAVTWLARAADAAAGASAFTEAAHHLRAAIELAAPEKLPELYGWLGDAVGSGDRAVEAYLTSVRVGREQGRDSNFLLRNLSSALRVYARWFASVTRQPPRAEIDRLREEARALLATATDERAKAIFLMSEGFFPYWIRNSGLESTPDELAAAEVSARGALEIAERLNDAPLTSAALDALSALVQNSRADEAAVMQARRLTLEPLDLAERSDAYYTSAWVRALLGQLDEVIHLSEEGLAIAESAHGAIFSIGIAAWGVYGLTLKGRWVEVPALASRERALWIEAERPYAGLSLHGFYSALAVARGRQDQRAEATWRDILREILGAFDSAHPTAALTGIVTLDVERLVAEVLLRPDRFPGERSYHLEHVLGLVTDHRAEVSTDLLAGLVKRGADLQSPLLEGQARRALGIAERRPDHLERAVELFESVGAAAYLARARIELGQLQGDPELVRSGTAALTQIGDLDYLGRMGLA